MMTSYFTETSKIIINCHKYSKMLVMTPGSYGREPHYYKVQRRLHVTEKCGFCDQRGFSEVEKQRIKMQLKKKKGRIIYGK